MSMSTDATTPTPMPTSRRRRTPGWYIPWIFVGALAFVAVVNGVMVHYAVSTFNGLETEDHFVKGIKYNRDLAGARAQAERAWKVDYAFDATEAGKGVVAVTLHDKFGNLLKDATVTVRFIRPIIDGYDREMTLPYLGEGRYGQAVELPLSGVWDLRLVINHASGDFQDQKRVWVK